MYVRLTLGHQKATLELFAATWCNAMQVTATDAQGGVRGVRGRGLYKTTHHPIPTPGECKKNHLIGNLSLGVPPHDLFDHLDHGRLVAALVGEPEQPVPPHADPVGLDADEQQQAIQVIHRVLKNDGNT